LIEFAFDVESGEILKATDQFVGDKDLRDRAHAGAFAKLFELAFFAVEIDLLKVNAFFSQQVFS
jgi:hypothetical protein